MNRLFKIKLSIIAPVLLLVAAPATVGAAERAERTKPTSASTESSFCTKLTGETGNITAKLGELKGRKDTAVSKRDQDKSADRTKWGQELTENRTKWDAERATNFAKLEAKATTPTQVAAVKAYGTTITNAVTARRAANDAARANFKTGVDAAVAAQHSNLTAQTNAFTASINSAVATAKAACLATPTNSATIKATLQASLKTARETFQTGRKSDNSVGTKVKALAATRNTAIKANNTAFQTATKAAKDTLKAAFGDSSV